MLYRGARILILDEPTAVLVPQEVDELFANLAELQAEGLTVIFISHKLDEVLKVADAITVIRRGTTVGTADPRRSTTRQLAELMVGSELPAPETRESTVTDHVVLGVHGVSAVGSEGPHGCSTTSASTCTAGEVVGIAGVEGNGQAELVEALIGLRPPHRRLGHAGRRGHHRLDHPRRREAGIGFIPEDRHRQGLLLERPAVGEPDARPPGPGRPSAAGFLRPPGRPGRHRADHARVRRPRPRASTRWPAPCPAATSRS